MFTEVYTQNLFAVNIFKSLCVSVWLSVCQDYFLSIAVRGFLTIKELTYGNYLWCACSLSPPKSVLPSVRPSEHPPPQEAFVHERFYVGQPFLVWRFMSYQSDGKYCACPPSSDRLSIRPSIQSPSPTSACMIHIYFFLVSGNSSIGQVRWYNKG